MDEACVDTPAIPPVKIPIAVDLSNDLLLKSSPLANLAVSNAAPLMAPVIAPVPDRIPNLTILVAPSQRAFPTAPIGAAKAP